jgi:hypothetical protein
MAVIVCASTIEDCHQPGYFRPALQSRVPREPVLQVDSFGEFSLVGDIRRQAHRDDVVLVSWGLSNDRSLFDMVGVVDVQCAAHDSEWMAPVCS